MADGWRNRYLAPVYALVISFVIVLLAGLLALPTTAPSAKIRFVSAMGLPAKGLHNTPVKLVGGDPPTATVDANGEISLLAPDKRFTICADLPDGWSAIPKKLEDSPSTCWGPFETGTHDLQVIGPGG